MSRKASKSSASLHVNGKMALSTSGVAIEAFQTNGSGKNEKIGTLVASAGSVRWIPAGARKPYRLTWPQLKELVEAFGRRG